MLKKRVIFTLLFDRGQFMLSRNFRLQKVGDLSWLQRNYNFADVAFFIDELVVLDVSRGERERGAFLKALTQISAGCFAPISAGGGIDSVEYTKELLRAGADKVVVNSSLFENPDLVRDIATEFGQQCVVGSVDLKRNGLGRFDVFTQNGSNRLPIPPADAMQWCEEGVVGEIYLNSIDRDGTGQGYDFDALGVLPANCALPIIMAGGVGNAKHLAEGLGNPLVDAVATAHLFNFVGDGLKRARHALIDQGMELAVWEDIGSFNRRHHREGAVGEC